MKIKYVVSDNNFSVELDRELDEIIKNGAALIRAELDKNHYRLVPGYFIEEHMAVVINRDYPDSADEEVDLGCIPVEQEQETNINGIEVRLCNKDASSGAMHVFSPDQNIGAVKAYLRQEFQVPLEQEITVTYGDSPETIDSGLLVADLKSKELLWETTKKEE